MSSPVASTSPTPRGEDLELARVRVDLATRVAGVTRLGDFGAPTARRPRTDQLVARELPRSERLLRILERDGAECVWCRRPLAPGDRESSIEHVVPRLKGGPAWPENEVCACRACNRRRGHLAPALWLDQCEARGLEPRRDVIVASLLRLRDAIAQRGGQRRARPYLDAQLRRLGIA